MSKDDLKQRLRGVPKDELQKAAEALRAEAGSRNPAYGGPGDPFWRRDPFEVARDLCGSRVEVYHGKRRFNNVLIYDVQAWRELPNDRGRDIVGREPGMVYSFPLRRGKPTGGLYHRLCVLAHPDHRYPTGLVTIAGVEVDSERISALERVFLVLEVDEATTGEPFVTPAKRLLVASTPDVQGLVAPYDVKQQDPRKVRGYKGPRA